MKIEFTTRKYLLSSFLLLLSYSLCNCSNDDNGNSIDYFFDENCFMDTFNLEIGAFDGVYRTTSVGFNAFDFIDDEYLILAVSELMHPNRVVIYNWTKNVSEVLLDSTPPIESLKVSPNGQNVCFSSNGDLFYFILGDNVVKQINDSTLFSRDPGWLNDSETIVFTNNNNKLLSYSIPEKNLKQLYFEFGDVASIETGSINHQNEIVVSILNKGLYKVLIPDLQKSTKLIDFEEMGIFTGSVSRLSNVSGVFYGGPRSIAFSLANHEKVIRVVSSEFMEIEEIEINASDQYLVYQMKYPVKYIAGSLYFEDKILIIDLFNCLEINITPEF